MEILILSPVANYHKCSIAGIEVKAQAKNRNLLELCRVRLFRYFLHHLPFKVTLISSPLEDYLAGEAQRMVKRLVQ